MSSRSLLVIVGTGILAGDAGERVQRCLRESARLFCIEPAASFLEQHPACLDKCVSLDAVFDTLGHDRTAALRRIAEMVIEGCRGVQQAAFVLGGHPTLGVRPVQHLLALRPDWLMIDVIPGVSSVDWMMADLGLDATEAGLQIIGGHLCGSLSAALPVAIVSPGYARSVAFADRLAALATLARDLAASYGGAAEFIIYSRGVAGCRLRRMPVGDLVALAGEKRLGEALLVGPVALLPHMDAA